MMSAYDGAGDAGTPLAAKEIGPRVVGGRYRSAYRGLEYDVVDITRSSALCGGWSITVQYADRPCPVTHATAWHPDDEIVATPPQLRGLDPE